MARLLVSTPAYDPRVYLETYAAMVSMDACGMDVDCFTPEGFGIEQARTMTANRAIEGGYDWILFVDSDIVPPKDALGNLLSHNRDMVFGYYTKGKNSEGRTCLCDVDRDNYDSFLHKDELHEIRDAGTHLIEIRGGGFGFALMRTRILQRVEQPWFDYVWAYDGRKLSEDYGFCTRCRKAGIKLYADTRVDCGHVKQVVM